MSDVDEYYKTHLSGDYIMGYTAALLDVKKILSVSGLCADMKFHKVKLNPKSIGQILDCMIEGRGILREKYGAFVRCKQGGGFEIAIEGEIKDGNRG